MRGERVRRMPCWRSLPARLLLLLLLPGAPEAEVAEVTEVGAAGQEVPPCPARCACYAPVEVHCTFRSLASFPAGVWRGVERVNLGYNAMTSLPASALAGLSRLRLLLLHGNEIEEIQDGALRDLGALQVLKLSYNRLRALTAGALRGARALTRLHLDHNRLAALDADALLGLTSLRLLTLEGNALASLPPGGLATFDLPAGRGRGRGPFRVSTLRHLSLAGNALTSLPPALLPAAPLLETLALHGNPWACDCARAGWVGAWTAGVRAALRCRKDKDGEGGTSCPVCASPAHFRNRDLRDLGAADVTCASPALQSPLRKNGTRDPEVDDDGDDVIALGGPGDDIIVMEMADAHGTRVTLACDPRAAGPPRVADVSAVDPEAEGAGLVVEAAVTLDLACAVTRDGGYERTWRLLAYYGEVSAALAAADPEPGSSNTGTGGKDDITARYAQDPDDADALYYTGLRVNLTTPPEWAWLGAPRLFRLRLDRKRTTARRVLVTYEARLSRALPGDAVDVTGDADGDATSWVAIAPDPDAGGVIAREGEDVRLPCDVTASATASVTWRLPDGAVATGTLVAAPAGDVAARARGDDLKRKRSRGSRVHDVGKAVPVAGQRRKPRSPPRPDVTVLGDGSLLLRAARTDDAGRYVCAASVGAAQDRATRRLVVTSRSGPSRDDDAAMLRATPGAVLTLPCAVSGAATAASLAWELPGGRLLRRGESASSGGAVVDGNGTLELTPRRGGDSGRFRCVAVNQAGSDAFAVEVAVDAAGARGDDAGADVTGGDAEEASGAGPGHRNRTMAGAGLRAADEGDGDGTGGNRSSRTGSRKLAAGTGERPNRKSAAERRKSMAAATPEVTSLGPSPGQPWKLVAGPGAHAGREGGRGRRVHVTNARVLARVQGRNLPRAGGDVTEATPTPGDFPSPAPAVAAETDADVGREALRLVTDAADVIGANDIIERGDITVSRDDVIGGADIANASDVANRTGGGCANGSDDIINCTDVINASDIVNRTHDIINTTVANVSAPSAEEEAAETEEEEESVEAPPLMFPGRRDVIPAPPPAPALRFQPGSNSASSAGGDFQLWPGSSASGSSEQRPRGGEFRFRTVGAFPPSRKGSRRRKWPWGIPLPTTSDPPTSGSGTTWGTPATPISDVTAAPRDRRGRKRVRNRGRQAPPPTSGPAQLQLPVPEAPPPEVSQRRKSGRKSGGRRTTASSRELEVVTAGGGLSATSPVRHAELVKSLPVTSPTLGSVTGAFADVTVFSLNDAVTKTATDDIIRGTEDDVTAQTATDDITLYTDDAVAGISTDDVAAPTDDVTDAAADGVVTEPEPDAVPEVGTDDVIQAFVTPDLVADLAPGPFTAFPKETTGDVTDWSDITSDGVTTETPATPDAGDVTTSASDDVTGDVTSKSMDDVITGAGEVIAHPARPLPDALSASGSAEAPPPPAELPRLAPPPALEAETSRSDEEATASSQTPQQEVLVAAATVTPPPLPAVRATSSRPCQLPVRPEVAEFPPPPPQAPPSFRFSLPRAGVAERSTPPLPPAPGIPLTPHFRPPRIHAHLGPPAPPASRGLYRVTSRDPAVALMTSSATSPARRPLVHVRRGSRLRLRCEAVGFPAPHVVWRLPSRRLLDRFAGPDPRVSVAPDGSLSVAPVTERDAGDYACLAGDASAAFTVHVLAGADPAPSGFASGSTYGKYRVAVRLAVTPDPPWRVADAAAVPVISARVGSSVRVACRGAAGMTSPVTWQLPDGTRVTSFTPVTSSPRARVDPRGWLTLWPLAPGDAGLYRCWAPGGVTRAVVVRVD